MAVKAPVRLKDELLAQIIFLALELMILMEEEVQEQKDHYILIVALSQMIIIWEVEEVDRAVLRLLLELVGVEDILILITMALIILRAVAAAVAAGMAAAVALEEDMIMVQLL